jgi:type II secretory pathway component GspD/PulD (secretin)
MRAVRFVLATVLAFAVFECAAQQVMEVITLRHATVEQVLPSLRPLLEPGGTLTGQGGQLIVRASPANVEDLRLALEVLDRPARRLQISVRFDGVREAEGVRSDRVDQRVQVVEGGRAFIALRQSRPVQQRQRVRTPGGVVSQETFAMQDASTGFEVSPRLAGDRVFVDIAQQRQAFSGSGVREAGVSTSASGRLGEWFELGAIASDGPRAEGATRVWVKVEELTGERHN